MGLIPEGDFIPQAENAAEAPAAAPKEVARIKKTLIPADDFLAIPKEHMPSLGTATLYGAGRNIIPSLAGLVSGTVGGIGGGLAGGGVASAYTAPAAAFVASTAGAYGAAKAQEAVWKPSLREQLAAADSPNAYSWAGLIPGFATGKLIDPKALATGGLKAGAKTGATAAQLAAAAAAKKAAWTELAMEVGGEMGGDLVINAITGEQQNLGQSFGQALAEGVLQGRQTRLGNTISQSPITLAQYLTTPSAPKPATPVTPGVQRDILAEARGAVDVPPVDPNAPIPLGQDGLPVATQGQIAGQNVPAITTSTPAVATPAVATPAAATPAVATPATAAPAAAPAAAAPAAPAAPVARPSVEPGTAPAVAVGADGRGQVSFVPNHIPAHENLAPEQLRAAHAAMEPAQAANSIVALNAEAHRRSNGIIKPADPAFVERILTHTGVALQDVAAKDQGLAISTGEGISRMLEKQIASAQANPTQTPYKLEHILEMQYRKERIDAIVEHLRKGGTAPDPYSAAGAAAYIDKNKAAAAEAEANSFDIVPPRPAFDLPPNSSLVKVNERNAAVADWDRKWADSHNPDGSPIPGAPPSKYAPSFPASGTSAQREAWLKKYGKTHNKQGFPFSKPQSQETAAQPDTQEAQGNESDNNNFPEPTGDAKKAFNDALSTDIIDGALIKGEVPVVSKLDERTAKHLLQLFRKMANGNIRDGGPNQLGYATNLANVRKLEAHLAKLAEPAAKPAPKPASTELEPEASKPAPKPAEPKPAKPAKPLTKKEKRAAEAREKAEKRNKELVDNRVKEFEEENPNAPQDVKDAFRVITEHAGDKPATPEVRAAWERYDAYTLLDSENAQKVEAHPGVDKYERTFYNEDGTVANGARIKMKDGYTLFHGPGSGLEYTGIDQKVDGQYIKVNNDADALNYIDNIVKESDLPRVKAHAELERAIEDAKHLKNIVAKYENTLEKAFNVQGKKRKTDAELNRAVEYVAEKKVELQEAEAKVNELTKDYEAKFGKFEPTPISNQNEDEPDYDPAEEPDPDEDPEDVAAREAAFEENDAENDKAEYQRNLAKSDQEIYQEKLAEAKAGWKRGSEKTISQLEKKIKSAEEQIAKIESGDGANKKSVQKQLEKLKSSLKRDKRDLEYSTNPDYKSDADLQFEAFTAKGYTPVRIPVGSMNAGSFNIVSQMHFLSPDRKHEIGYSVGSPGDGFYYVKRVESIDDDGRVMSEDMPGGRNFKTMEEAMDAVTNDSKASKPSPRDGVAINGTPEGDAVIEEMKNVLKAKGFKLVQMYGGKPEWSTKELHQSFKDPSGKFEIGYGMNKYTVTDEAVKGSVHTFETLDEAVMFMEKLADVFTGVSRYSSEGPDSEIGYYVNDDYVAHGGEKYADSPFLSNLKALKDMGISIDDVVESLDHELTGFDENGLRSIWTTLIDGSKTGKPTDTEEQAEAKPEQLGGGVQRGELFDSSGDFSLASETVAPPPVDRTEDTTGDFSVQSEPAHISQARSQLAKLEKSGKNPQQQEALRGIISYYEQNARPAPDASAKKDPIPEFRAPKMSDKDKQVLDDANADPTNIEKRNAARAVLDAFKAKGDAAQKKYEQDLAARRERDRQAREGKQEVGAEEKRPDEAPRTDLKGVKGFQRGIQDMRDLLADSQNDKVRELRQANVDKMEALLAATKDKPTDNVRLETQRRKLRELLNGNNFRPGRSSGLDFAEMPKVRDIMARIANYEKLGKTSAATAESVLTPVSDNEPASITEARQQLSRIISNMSRGEGWDAKRRDAEAKIEQFELENKLLSGKYEPTPEDMEIISNAALEEFVAKFGSEDVDPAITAVVEAELAARLETQEKSGIEDTTAGDATSQKGDLLADIKNLIAEHGSKYGIPTLPKEFGAEGLSVLREQLSKGQVMALMRNPVGMGEVDANRARTDATYRKEMKDKAEGQLSDLATALSELGWTQFDPANFNTDDLVQAIVAAGSGEMLTPKGGVLGVAAPVDMKASGIIERLYQVDAQAKPEAQPERQPEPEAPAEPEKKFKSIFEGFDVGTDPMELYRLYDIATSIQTVVKGSIDGRMYNVNAVLAGKNNMLTKSEAEAVKRLKPLTEAQRKKVIDFSEKLGDPKTSEFPSIYAVITWRLEHGKNGNQLVGMKPEQYVELRLKELAQSKVPDAVEMYKANLRELGLGKYLDQASTNDPFSRRDVGKTDAPLVDAVEEAEARRLGDLFKTKRMQDFVGERKVVPQTADEGFADFIKNFRNAEIDQRTALFMLDEIPKLMFGGLDRQTKRIRLQELREKSVANFEKENPNLKGRYGDLPDRHLERHLTLPEVIEYRKLDKELSQPAPEKQRHSPFTGQVARDFAKKIEEAKKWVRKASPQYNDFSGYLADNIPMREYYQHSVYSNKFRTGDPVAVVGVHGTSTSEGFIKNKRYEPRGKSLEQGEAEGAYFAASDATVLSGEYQGYDNAGKSPNVAKSVITFDNPLVVNGQFTDVMKRTEKILGEAIAAGHDGVIYINQTDGGNLDVSFIIPANEINARQRMIGSTLDKSMAGDSYEPLPRGEGKTSGTEVLSRRDLSPEAAKRELERRQAQNAKNREGDPETRKGYQGIVSRITDELRLRGELSPKEIEGVTRIMNKIGAQFFEGVKMKIGAGSRLGEYGQYQTVDRIITIFKDAIRNGKFEETAAHEIAHHIARFLPEADRIAVIKEMQSKRTDFLKDHKGLETLFSATENKDWSKKRFNAQQVANANLANPTEVLVKLDAEELKKEGYKPGQSVYRLKLTDETYRLTNPNEYFAEEFKDNVMRELNSDPVYLGRSRNWKEKLAGLWQDIKINFRKMFGKEIANKILSNFAKGRYNPENEGGAMIEGVGSDRSWDTGTVLNKNDRKLKAEPVVSPETDESEAVYPVGEAMVRNADGSTDVVNILGRNKMSPERAEQIKEFVKDSAVKHALYRGQQGAYETLDANMSEDGLFHIAADPDYAAQYAQDHSKKLPEDGTESAVVQVYINAKNIVDISKIGHSIDSRSNIQRMRRPGTDGLTANEHIAKREDEFINKIISEVERINEGKDLDLTELREGLVEAFDEARDDMLNRLQTSVWQVFSHSSIHSLFAKYGVDAIKYSDSDLRTAQGGKKGGKDSYVLADPRRIKAAFGGNDVNTASSNIFQNKRERKQGELDMRVAGEVRLQDAMGVANKSKLTEAEFERLASEDPSFNQREWQSVIEEGHFTSKGPDGRLTGKRVYKRIALPKMVDPSAEVDAQAALPDKDVSNSGNGDVLKSVRDVSENQSEDREVFNTPRPNQSVARSAWDVVSGRFFSGMSGKAHQNAKRHPYSDAVKAIANIIHARPGTTSNAYESDLPTAISTNRTKYHNRLNKIMEPLRGMLGGFKDNDQGTARDQREEVYQALTDMITGRKQITSGPIGEAARGLKNLLSEIHDYRKKSGEEIGSVSDYFPAVYDSPRIGENRKGFIRDAKTAYEIEFAKMGEEGQAKELGLTKAEFADLSENDPQKLKDDLADLAEQRAIALYNAHVRGASAEEFDSIFGMADKSGAENPAMKRKFGREAQDIMRKWQVNDPFRVVGRYVTSGVKRAEVVRRFGNKGEKWSKLSTQMEKDGVPYDVISEMRELVRGAAGIGIAPRGKAGQTFVDTVTLATAASAMGRGFLNNLVEPVTIGMRTGSPIDILRAYAETWTRFLREIPALSQALKAKMGETFWSQYGHEIGTIHNTIEDAWMTTHSMELDAEYADPRFRWLTNRVYKANLMDATETAKQQASHAIGFSFINRLSSMAAGNHWTSKLGLNAKQSASDQLAELGVKPEDQAEFIEWCAELDAANDSKAMGMMLADDKMAALHREAMTRFSMQSSVRSNRAHKPTFQDDPLGKAFLQLMNFSYSYAAEVNTRMYDMAKQAFWMSPPGKDYTKYDRLRMMGPIAGGLLSILAYRGLLELKDLLYPSESSKQRAKDPAVVKWVNATSYAGLLGPKFEQMVKSIKRDQAVGGPVGQMAVNVGRAGKSVLESAAEGKDMSAAKKSIAKASVPLIKGGIVTGAAAVNPMLGTVATQATNAPAFTNAIVPQEGKSGGLTPDVFRLK